MHADVYLPSGIVVLCQDEGKPLHENIQYAGLTGVGGPGVGGVGVGGGGGLGLTPGARLVVMASVTLAGSYSRNETELFIRELS